MSVGGRAERGVTGVVMMSELLLLLVVLLVMLSLHDEQFVTVIGEQVTLPQTGVHC